MFTKKINFVVTAFNEESRIISVLNSIQPFASKIIVLDAGSTDNTVSIIHSHSSDVIVKLVENPYNFKSRINSAREFISDDNDWVMVISCSEFLPSSLGFLLLDKINSSKKLVGVDFYRQSYTFGVPTHSKKFHYLITMFCRTKNYRLFRLSFWNSTHSRMHVESPVNLPSSRTVLSLLPKKQFSLIHTRSGSLNDIESKHSLYSSREAIEMLSNTKKPSLLKGLFVFLIVFLYFLPTIFYNKKAFIAGFYHAFYKFQVQAKAFLHSQSD